MISTNSNNASATSTSTSAPALSGPPSTKRRDDLLAIERKVQASWADHHTFECDSGVLPRDDQAKYFATFPYPYMNGALHLGHAFTVAKVDFQCNFQRLLGKKVLFPFGFHCTGMPIAACADKLKREMAKYGCPPNFPVDVVPETQDSTTVSPDATAGAVDAEETEEEEKSSEPITGATAVPAANKKRKTKAKVAKKGSKEVYQWNILLEMGVPAADVPLFADSLHWLQYFPPIAIRDLNAFGLCADFRRSFITTSVNPYYDAFIQWQFRTLKKRDRLAFGARLSIFSPIDNQTCADHDRAEGENVGITDYTLIKLKLFQPYPPSLSSLLVNHPSHTVFLPAATLRPETMYGQTNVFLLPEGEYGVYVINDNEIFVCSDKSALNMSYQSLSQVRGKPLSIGTVTGMSLMGQSVSAPLTKYEKVYVLPLVTIKMDKGTGVVTSVPSDAPDDYAALMDLKKKVAFREKFHIEDHMVLPYEVIPIINTPGLGTTPAPDLCIQAKVASQNDRAKLEEIKEKVYKEGFAKGIMIIGEYSGQPVMIAKNKIKADLIAAGLAYPYSEPESKVVSRSGNECVVAYSDQWYLKYGEEGWWKSAVKSHIETTLDTYNPQAKKDFLAVIEWLHEWAMSRSYGLGTYVPWDQQYVIESLSDSTIYMAYYTIAHYLQGGINNLNGSAIGPANITVDQLNDSVFDYIFIDGPEPDTQIPITILEKLRNEFKFWYPMNLRVSGKDLIPNHLTFSLYNHAAIWPDQSNLWPRSFFTNGHIMIDAKKMSKSLGNFITLSQAVQEYSADATRFTLADAGDSLDDANFDRKNANAAILKLTREEVWIREEILPIFNNLRSGPYNFTDRVFNNELNLTVSNTHTHYTTLSYRLALKACFHDLTTSRDTYRIGIISDNNMHIDLIKKYLNIFTILLSPICPHFCQHIWELITPYIPIIDVPILAHARWPRVDPVDLILQRQINYIRDTNALLRKSYTEQLNKFMKSKVKNKDIKSVTASAGDVIQNIDSLIIFIASSYPIWQQDVIQLISSLYQPNQPLPGRGTIIPLIKNKFGSDKKQLELATKFTQTVLEDLESRGSAALELSLPFDENQLLTDEMSLAMRELPTNIKVRVEKVENVDELVKSVGTEASQSFAITAAKALPGRPSPNFYKSV